MRTRKNKLLSYFLMAFLLMNCQNNQSKNGNNVEISPSDKENSKLDKVNDCSFEVYFIQKGTAFPISMGCLNEVFDPEKSDTFFYKKVNNESFIRKFLVEYEKLNVSEEQKNLDARITLYMKCFGKKTDTLCFGESYGVMLNGTRMNDSPLLLTLIKNEIQYSSTFRTKEEILNRKN